MMCAEWGSMEQYAQEVMQLQMPDHAALGLEVWDFALVACLLATWQRLAVGPGVQLCRRSHWLTPCSCGLANLCYLDVMLHQLSRTANALTFPGAMLWL